MYVLTYEKSEVSNQKIKYVGVKNSLLNKHQSKQGSQCVLLAEKLKRPIYHDNGHNYCLKVGANYAALLLELVLDHILKIDLLAH